MTVLYRRRDWRRQWLLQEKRRWIVEMRLGKTGDATLDGGAGAGADGATPKLPQLGASPRLSNGLATETIATPR